ncbi:hypothetical protein WN944_026809 [Citrus x changshan-huyou]|uniref:Uncharacterized protein n=1 Tax=Citrus x changshan-huyou TaxID=2935761 RepID=A0AAP0LJL5_9ROSI
MDLTPVNWEALDALILEFAKSENLIEDSIVSSPPSSPSSSSTSSVSLSSSSSSTEFVKDFSDENGVKRGCKVLKKEERRLVVVVTSMFG